MPEYDVHMYAQFYRTVRIEAPDEETAEVLAWEGEGTETTRTTEPEEWRIDWTDEVED